MSFTLKRKRPLPEEFRRIGVELADATVAHLRDGDVHQTRRRIKELRALLALAKGDPAAPELDRLFRDAARAISGARDDEICMTTLARLEKTPEAPPAAVFEKARATVHKQAVAASGREEVLERLEAGRQDLANWNPDASRKIIRQALRRSYRRCRRALEALQAKEEAGNSDEEAFHRLRRRIKRLWAQLRLVRKECTKTVKKRIRKADKIAELLGLEHDLAVLRTRLRQKHASQVLSSRIEEERAELQKMSLAKTRRFLRRKPKIFLKKLL